jgi:hypothetical protein
MHWYGGYPSVQIFREGSTSLRSQSSPFSPFSQMICEPQCLGPSTTSHSVDPSCIITSMLIPCINRSIISSFFFFSLSTRPGLPKYAFPHLGGSYPIPRPRTEGKDRDFKCLNALNAFMWSWKGIRIVKWPDSVTYHDTCYITRPCIIPKRAIKSQILYLPQVCRNF